MTTNNYIEKTSLLNYHNNTIIHSTKLLSKVLYSIIKGE